MEKKIKLKRYKTAGDVFAAQFNQKYEDIRDGESGATAIKSGKTISFPVSDAVSSIEAGGVWGFSDVKKRTIHYWLGKPPKSFLIEFFAHELSHIFGPNKKKEMQEERRANEYGRIASRAYDLLEKSVKKTKNS